ncbi:MAG: carbohydrate kinase [Silvibacterium sp.]|nr:carbohydrate kinase [Silvibacterium sp.]MBV8437428.1 carbohydrate kinase [Silvibacterium sp.]
MNKVIVGLGELLWDMLPTGNRLGGAPANFTVMAARLGNRGVIASRLGNDTLGTSAKEVLSAFPVDISRVQTDPAQPTGTVGVAFRTGEPHYIIHEPAAWDYMQWTSVWRTLAESADAICFGSLGQRNPVSRATIREFLAATRPDCVRVFDVNLRAPFFDADTIAASLASATIFKLNELEVPQVLAMLEIPQPSATSDNKLLEAARLILLKYPLKLVAITMGGSGSLLVSPDAHHRHHGVPVKVADTVGAGDAFTASLVDAWLRGASLAEMNEAGNRWGGWVASQPGAMPDLNADALAIIANQI